MELRQSATPAKNVHMPLIGVTQVSRLVVADESASAFSAPKCVPSSVNST